MDIIILGSEGVRKRRFWNMDNLQLFIQERVRKLRANSDISARELSLAIGQGHGYISQIENGVHLPSLEGLLYICEYFDITLSDFFNKQIENPEIIKEVVEIALNTDIEILLDLICLFKKIYRMQDNNTLFRKKRLASRDISFKTI